MKQALKVTRIDTHRPCIMELEAEEACAVESCVRDQNNRGKDMAGLKFGRLTVISKAPNSDRRRNWRWECACDCGAKVITYGYLLRNGESKSCGCYQKDRVRELNKANKTHGMSGTSTYNIWDSMIQRCENENRKDYFRYGGSGIAVCDRWKKFDNFLADMGERPDGRSLDRYPNPSGGYEPGNCRWATASQQQRNKVTSRMLTVFGESRCIADWADITGIFRKVISKRLNAGWSALKAISTPIREDSRHASKK